MTLGLEIYALKKKPGIYSARWAKRSGSFKKAMIRILKKIKNKKNRKARFICSLSIRLNKKKVITSVGIINVIYHLKYWEIKDLGMTQFLFLIILNNIWTNKRKKKNEN